MAGARSRKLASLAGLDRAAHLVERQDLVAHQQVQLVAEVQAQHLRAVGADGEADTIIHECADHAAQVGDAAQHAGVEVRARADLEHGAPLPQHRQHARVVRAADAVADAVRLERLERLPHLVGAAGLAGVDGEAQAGAAALAKDVGVVGEAEAIDTGPAMSMPTTPRLRQAIALAAMISFSAGESSVEAEDEPGAHLRVFEHGAVHARAPRPR